MTKQLGTRVLFSFREPSKESNPYVHLLAAALQENNSLRFFDWRAALFGRYDVFHVHWPETLVRGSSVLRTMLRRTLFLLLLLRIRSTGVRLVRTLHNVTPHEEGPSLERFLLRMMDQLTDAWIVLNVDDSVRRLNLPPQKVWYAPHGHFRDWYRSLAKDETRPRNGQLLLFGKIRPYKGIEPLIDIISRMPAESGVRLVVAGEVTDAPLRARIEDAVIRCDQIDAYLRFVSDRELVDLIRSSHLVVLPYLRMLNSGAVLTALSLGRPVLVPRNEVNEALAREVGPLWVQMYDQPLTARQVIAAIRATPVERIETSSPQLGLRDWSRTAAVHYDAYVGRRS